MDRNPPDGGELNFAEIARELGVSRETVRKDYQRALKKIETRARIQWTVTKRSA